MLIKFNATFKHNSCDLKKMIWKKFCDEKMFWRMTWRTCLSPKARAHKQNAMLIISWESALVCVQISLCRWILWIFQGFLQSARFLGDNVAIIIADSGEVANPSLSLVTCIATISHQLLSAFFTQHPWCFYHFSQLTHKHKKFTQICKLKKLSLRTTQYPFNLYIQLWSEVGYTF